MQKRRTVHDREPDSFQLESASTSHAKASTSQAKASTSQALVTSLTEAGGPSNFRAGAPRTIQEEGAQSYDNPLAPAEEPLQDAPPLTWNNILREIGDPNKPTWYRAAVTNCVNNFGQILAKKNPDGSP